MMILTVSLVDIQRKRRKMSKTVASKYVSTYQEDYYKLLWYERDMMSYIDHVEYKTMRDVPDSILTMLK